MEAKQAQDAQAAQDKAAGASASQDAASKPVETTETKAAEEPPTPEQKEL